MKVCKLAIVLCFAAGSIASLPLMAMPLDGPSYYVRPGLRVGGGEFQDGLTVNGPTTASQTQGVVGTSRSTVSLVDGTVKMYADELFSSAVGLQAFGGFGERVTVNGGLGTNWGISFGIEGDISGQLGPAAPGAPVPTVVYDIGVVVLEAGIANADNFLFYANDPCYEQDPLNCVPLPAALANAYSQALFEVPVEDWQPTGSNDFFESVSASVDVNIALTSNSAVFDIFTYTNVFMAFDTVGSGSGLESYTLDFENTATYSQTFANGVEVFSSSGEFLGLEAPPTEPPTDVPAPGSLPLLGLGLLSLLWRRGIPGRSHR